MRERKKITRKTASRAAKAVISAQETIFPHFLWIRPLRSSMVFNASGLMPPLACSPFSSFPPFASSSNDPSHPYTHIKINIVPFSSCMKKFKLRSCAQQNQYISYRFHPIYKACYFLLVIPSKLANL